MLYEKSGIINYLLEQWLRQDYKNAREENKTKVLEKAVAIADKFDGKFLENSLIKHLQAKNFDTVIDIINNNYHKLFGNKFFGLFQVADYDKYALRLFGMKISFKHKRLSKGAQWKQ